MDTFGGPHWTGEGEAGETAIRDCQFCLTAYDPAAADGTPFHLLPEDWTCPTCAAPKDHFAVREAPETQAAIAAAAGRLVQAVRAPPAERATEEPAGNPALRVEAVGFRRHGAQYLGVLITPWFMQLVLLPGAGQDWSGLRIGAEETVTFPSGPYRFLHSAREGLGGYKACALFSPVRQFASQQEAVAVARAVMVALFDSSGQNGSAEAIAPVCVIPDEAPPAARAAMGRSGRSGRSGRRQL